MRGHGHENMVMKSYGNHGHSMFPVVSDHYVAQLLNHNVAKAEEKTLNWIFIYTVPLIIYFLKNSVYHLQTDRINKGNQL